MQVDDRILFCLEFLCGNNRLVVEGVCCRKVPCGQQIVVRDEQGGPASQPFLAGFAACVPGIGVVEEVVNVLGEVDGTVTG